ncbi:unnamed protein product [Mytilus edulis]|uniref:Uncharacterized protein n=1 Tax=Mytilus edulis TaxID=6550 RepID=A0A8S3TJ20_MYTED|nr:unnamed protein product [Mytilus edulis]
MESDSDDDWYDEDTNRRRNLLRNIQSQQGNNTESLQETPESLFHEDRRQSHLMIPICKTIPKINILHGRLAQKYPERLRTRVEIHKHDSATNDLKFHKYHDITEADKENWLFIVVLLKWKLTNIHPLGAVIGVVHSSKDIEGGIDTDFFAKQFAFMV